MASLPDGRMTSISEVTGVYGVSVIIWSKLSINSRAGFVTAVRENGGIRWVKLG